MGRAGASAARRERGWRRTVRRPSRRRTSSQGPLAGPVGTTGGAFVSERFGGPARLCTRAGAGSGSGVGGAARRSALFGRHALSLSLLDGPSCADTGGEVGLCDGADFRGEGPPHLRSEFVPPSQPRGAQCAVGWWSLAAGAPPGYSDRMGPFGISSGRSQWRRRRPHRCGAGAGTDVEAFIDHVDNRTVPADRASARLERRGEVLPALIAAHVGAGNRSSSLGDVAKPGPVC
jgi:hypothetical protein